MTILALRVCIITTKTDALHDAIFDVVASLVSSPMVRLQDKALERRTRRGTIGTAVHANALFAAPRSNFKIPTVAETALAAAFRRGLSNSNIALRAKRRALRSIRSFPAHETTG